MKALIPKHALFVAEYIKDFDGAKAVRRAGYKVSSDSSAASRGHTLLQRTDIQAAIADALEARIERVKIDSDWVLQTLFEEATADLADLYADDGSLKPIHEWPMVFRTGLVVGIEVEEVYAGSGEGRTQIGFMRKVKLSDRLRHKELIGKHVDVGAFRERVEHTGKDGGPMQSQVANVTPEQLAEAVRTVRDDY